MTRWLGLVVMMLVLGAMLPTAAQEDTLPDDLDPIVVDFGEIAGATEPASAFGGGNFAGLDVVAFSTGDGVSVGSLDPDGYHDWGISIPSGTPTALIAAVAIDDVLPPDRNAAVAITAPGPTARLYLVDETGNAELLAEKPGYVTTGGGPTFPDETLKFPLVSSGRRADVIWSYEPGMGVEEIVVADPRPNVHDIAMVGHADIVATFELYGADPTRALAQMGQTTDAVEIPGSPETLATAGDFQAIVGALGTPTRDGELHIYRFMFEGRSRLVPDPTFADAPQVTYAGVADKVAGLITLRNSNLLTLVTDSDRRLVLDLLDPDGNHLDRLVLGPTDSIHVRDVRPFLDAEGEATDRVAVVGINPDRSGYRALFLDVISSGRFIDDDDSIHENDIEAIAERGIAFGCNPPDNTRFCPREAVTRGQMAAFLTRAFELEPSGDNPFTDTTDSVFTDDITAIAEAGITFGCNPPENTEFCPAEDMTREQMAGFLARAFELEASGDSRFTDTEESVFVDDITAIAEAGITLGCNPPDNDRYCPRFDVTREQMASFIIRGLRRSE